MSAILNDFKTVMAALLRDKIIYMFSIDLVLYILLGLLFVWLFALVVHGFLKKSGKSFKKSVFARENQNPVIAPDSDFDWEAHGTFNPAVVKDDEGNVHLLYRAVGADGVSRIGYNKSADGVHFSGRLSYPVFSMDNPRADYPSHLKRHDFKLYPSGGSWGGAEDPRMVRIDGRIYVTFNAFDGWDFLRIGVISMNEDDFFEKRWKWTRPFFISPVREVHKNWVFFPEKINGKFAILHSITPAVQIDFVDRLEDLAHGNILIRSRFEHGAPRKSWDSFRRGVGPPPLKTEKGWLVFYHAIDKNEPGRYKLGAMLLDLKNPRRVIARAKEPLLVPDAWYENDWKPGIVYACGAVINDGKVFIYYGGGDKYVCVASAPVEEILGKMVKV